MAKNRLKSHIIQTAQCFDYSDYIVIINLKKPLKKTQQTSLTTNIKLLQVNNNPDQLSH